MISVIVPTMWKALEYTRPMLTELDKNDLIGEIIVIDNDRKNADHDLLKTIKKLHYWTFEEGNVFVNPAWNWGAKNAKYDKLFILNDDCYVNLAPLQKIYDTITPKIGMLGFSYMSYCTYTIEAYEPLSNSGFGSDINIEIIDPKNHPKTSGMPHPFYGSAYFIHKENYFQIPADFKIHYGDLFIYLSNLKKGVGNYVIEEGLVMTQYSSTVNTISRDILNREANIMREVMAENGLRNIKYAIPNMPPPQE